MTVDVPEDPETFSHDGVRKAVVLARYAQELREWARAIHREGSRRDTVDDWALSGQRGEHERGSVPLVVSDEYRERFGQLREYIEAEIDVLEDDILKKEVTLVTTLCENAPYRTGK